MPIWAFRNIWVLTFLITMVASTEDLDFTGNYKTKGDLIFGGLFPIHGDGSSEGKHCSDIMRLGSGYQRFEAMLYAIDEINKDQSLLPSLRIGVHILDTCSQDTHALEQTMEFTKAPISLQARHDYVCDDDSTPQRRNLERLALVIGAASSQVSVMVSNVLRLFKIPQISYSSTSIELSDRDRFEYFARVVPSDALQANVIVDIVKELDWTYVHAVHDEGQYGERGIELFKKLAKTQGVCISKQEKIRRAFQPADFDNIVQNLFIDPTVNGVIVWSDENNVRLLLEAVERAKKSSEKLRSRSLVFLATDNWGNKQTPINSQPSAAKGAITVMPRSTPVKDFERYFKSLINIKNRGIWAAEYWNHTVNCEPTTDRSCIDKVFRKWKQENFVPFVIDAVYAGAHALHNWLNATCPRNGTFKRCVHLANFTVDGKSLYEHIASVSFAGINGDEVVLDGKGDRKGIYSIFQLREYRPGKFTYITIGKWSSENGLVLNASDIAGEFDGKLPGSSCGPTCEPGQYKRPFQQCCWYCQDCPDDSIVTNTSCIDQSTCCSKCDLGKMPDNSRTVCIDIPVEYLEWLSVWAIAPILTSCLGICATLGVIAVFHKYRETPVIKASGRELCYFMLVGILLSYSITFFVLSKPTAFVCAILRLGLGFCLAMCYAAILTKTNRLARIFNGNISSAMSPKYITPKFQVLCCSAICSVQIFAALLWFIFEPPKPTKFHPDPKTAVMLCHGTTYTLIIPLSYNALLVVMCTVYAFKTRGIPESFNETKHIGFTMYSTCIVWLAFVPIYFGTTNFRIQLTSLCLCISICATVKLCCFFAPKVYICVFEPQKNVRQPTLTSWRAAQMQFFSQQVQMIQLKEVQPGVATDRTTLVVADTTTDASQESHHVNILFNRSDLTSKSVYNPPSTRLVPARIATRKISLPQSKNVETTPDIERSKTSGSPPSGNVSVHNNGEPRQENSRKIHLSHILSLLARGPRHRLTRTASADYPVVKRFSKRITHSPTTLDGFRYASSAPPPEAVLAAIVEDEGTML